jgi:hypothetical protein
MDHLQDLMQLAHSTIAGGLVRVVHVCCVASVVNVIIGGVVLGFGPCHIGVRHDDFVFLVVQLAVDGRLMMVREWMSGQWSSLEIWWSGLSL